MTSLSNVFQTSSLVDIVNGHDNQINNLTAGTVNIMAFSSSVLNKGLSNEDWKDAFQAAVNYILAQSKRQRLVFPAGVYQYSVSPNWAIQNTDIVSEGEVRLRYTGTDNAVILDGAARPHSNVYKMKFGRFIIEAPSTAKDGFYIKCVHHSDIDIRVLGAGSTYNGVNVGFTVCNVFNIEVSQNPEGWYLDAQPQVGLRFSNILAGQIPSYNTFLNCIIEHTVYGAYLDDSLGNIFIGGTMEGCSNTGLWMGPAAGLNKFFGTDFEANSNMDVYCQGFENEFHGIDTLKIVDFSATAKDNSMFGGSHKSIALESGSTRNLISGVKYNRAAGDATVTGTISDSGTKNRLIDIRNVKGNNTENRPPAVTTVTVGTSPFSYYNTSGNEERILLIGGTMSSVVLNHGGVGDNLVGYTSQFIPLSPGDNLTITYTAAPTMRKYTT